MKIVTLVSLMILVLSFSGCTSSKVYNIEHQDIQNSQSKNDVGNAIINAASNLGWRTQNNGNGKIRAIFNRSRHEAVVSIVYDASSYSIHYISSRNLRYNAGSNTIHKAYNQWVRKLQININNILGGATLIRQLNNKPSITPNYDQRQNTPVEPLEEEQVNENVIFI